MQRPESPPTATESVAEVEKRRLRERHGSWFQRHADRLVQAVPWVAGMGMVGGATTMSGLGERFDASSPEGILALVGFGVAMVGGRIIAPSIARQMGRPKELRANLAEDKKKL